MKASLRPVFVGIFTGLVASTFGTEVLVPVDLTGATATQSSDYNGGQFPASLAIDGNLGNFTHTEIPETNATWTLSLAAKTSFDIIRIWNRGDGCCQARLQDITVTAFDDPLGANKVFTSPVLNPGNELNGPQRIDLSTPSLTAQSLQISRAAYDPNSHDGSVLSLGEVQLFDLQNVVLPSGTDLTQAGIIGMTATQSSEYGGYPATMAIDGNPGDFTHTASTDAMAQWNLDFGEDLLLESINLHNRESCCGSRLRDITISILDFGGSTVFTSTLLNPENVDSAFPNGPSDLLLDLLSLNGGKPIKGAKVVVSRTADPDLSGSGGQGNIDEGNVLSLGEVTVIGGSIPEPVTGALLLPAIAMLTARRRRA